MMPHVQSGFLSRILQHSAVVDDAEAAEGPSQGFDAVEDVEVLLALALRRTSMRTRHRAKHLGPR